jgi:hypothetical protein
MRITKCMRGTLILLAFASVLTYPLELSAQSGTIEAQGMCTTCNWGDDIFCDSGTCHWHGQMGWLYDNVQNHNSSYGWPYACSPQHTAQSSCNSTSALVLTAAEVIDRTLYQTGPIGLPFSNTSIAFQSDNMTIEVAMWCPSALAVVAMSVPVAQDLALRAQALVDSYAKRRVAGAGTFKLDHFIAPATEQSVLRYGWRIAHSTRY